MEFKVLLIAILSSFLLACSDATEQLNADYGQPQTRDRTLPAGHPLAETFRKDVFPIIEKRCVVCHGCYDAPCQLKLSSPEGIDRGASKQKVYNGERLLAADPTRLFIDAKSTEQWRKKEFFPVLNEREQTLLGNLQGSLMYQLLLQKQEHPTGEKGRLPAQFDYALGKAEQCVSEEDSLRDYKRDYPLLGMPYGLPALTSSEFETIQTWIGRGAPMSQPEPLSMELQALVNHWESKFNQQSMKAQLINRYLYEHLFLAHLYFADVVSGSERPLFFRMVRSSTPPGEAINEIATRRPYEDPQAKVYYRLLPEVGSILEKTHMPYALNDAREKRWNELFYNNAFSVNNLPDYKDSNPFIVFQDIPANVRYQFLLDEAYFTISGFIKGPVCRGSVALNVINDHFWVFFVKPGFTKSDAGEKFIREQAKNLSLPAEKSSQTFSVRDWRRYAKRNTNYVKAKSQLLSEHINYNKGLNIEEIWTDNENSALTIFRHFDSATVIKGSVGKQPKTAWVIDYPLLERIHYLLVAGFDVYGNIGHQVTTRLYMDFLRIEGEMNFISFLPTSDRKQTMASWYLDATDELSTYLHDHDLLYARPSAVQYQTSFKKEELMSILKHYVYTAQQKQEVSEKYRVPLFDNKLNQLSNLQNSVVRGLPEISYILIESKQHGDRLYTLLRHDAHKNVASLLNESKQRLPYQDTAGLYRGVIGSYPGLIFRVAERDKLHFVNAFSAATDTEKFTEVIARYGVRRSNPDFWQVSDKIHQLNEQENPIDSGLLDYNRLENW